MNYLHNTTYFDEKLNQQVTCVLHRDLKPGNVLLTTSFTAKVADFGASKALTASSEMTMTGTPIYMAPEVVTGESYNSSADVYSFAVLVFAMSCAKGDAYGAFAAMVEAENAFIDEDKDKDNDRGEMSSASVMAKVANDDLRPHIGISIKYLKVSK